MTTVDAMRLECERETREGEALKTRARLRKLLLMLFANPDALPEQRALGIVRGKISGKTSIKEKQMVFTSCGAAVCGRRSFPIRKKIIGHGMSMLRQQFAGSNGFLISRWAFPLLNQPAREHGTSIFFEPLVQKRADLLAKIGGMTQTREFVALQRVARG